MSDFWSATLEETVKNSAKLSRVRDHKNDAAHWLGQYAEAAPTSSNQGTENVPFQRWFHFKEAFSPKFVTDTLTSLPYRVTNCLDPFSGSGTTSVTCRMLGIGSEGVEVNPFLADLVEAKLTPLPAAKFCKDYERVISSAKIHGQDKKLVAGMPSTMTAHSPTKSPKASDFS